jgi:hypothetical protein
MRNTLPSFAASLWPPTWLVAAHLQSCPQVVLAGTGGSRFERLCLRRGAAHTGRVTPPHPNRSITIR